MTNQLFADYANKFSFSGEVGDAFQFIENAQLMKSELWERFVKQYELHSDVDDGWRGEYWGKMMRGACFVYSYTKKPELYQLLCNTVRDMISMQESDGRLSSYPRELEFDSWDIWSRKYVVLGMQYFLEICDDVTFHEDIVRSMCRQVDYIMEYIGQGKKEITSAAKFWRGMASSSILEPVVRLFNLTSEEKYLDFATYIVDNGGIDVANIFELAYEDKLYPYQYPVTKAYEMISCFEGLLEYYRATKIEKYKKSVLNFANKILESDFTIVGSAGCSHELFDHSTVRQANTTNGLFAQETCVTVTLMKFMYQLTLLTGDSKYADAFEISFYNAYLGALNTENKTGDAVKELGAECIIEPLPFDSYSPLVAGKRGNGIGGLKVMPDHHYYGCCACIGAVGVGMVPKIALLSSKDGFAMNMFVAGTITSKTPSGAPISFATETAYPKDGYVRIVIDIDVPEKFVLLIRNPAWSKHTSVFKNGKEIRGDIGYISIEDMWKKGDVIEISFDMQTYTIRPISYGHQLIMTKVPEKVMNYMVSVYDEEDPLAQKHIAFRRGPLILAQDSRLGYDLNVPIDPDCGEDGRIEAALSNHVAPYPNIIEVQIPQKDHTFITLTDYASAGKLWSDESLMAAWVLTKNRI